jgi:hypothetical protein
MMIASREIDLALRRVYQSVPAGRTPAHWVRATSRGSEEPQRFGWRGQKR